MHLRRCSVAQALVQALLVIEVEVVVQPRIQFRNGAIVQEVDVLVLDRAPQAFDKDERGSTPPMRLV